MMNKYSYFFVGLLLLLMASCDTNHKSEFYKIQRDDIQGYEQFIQKYPSSSLVTDARERIETAKEEKRQREELERKERERAERERVEREERERKEAEARILEMTYGNNSLSNGSQPYSQWYGNNLFFDDYTPHSEIRVKAPYNSDVIVIVRYNNMNGSVAGHKYIKAGQTVTIYLRNDNYYQAFFYYGKGWYPDKAMNGKVRGGFIKGEAFSKDGTSSYLNNQILSYELILQENGNFSTSPSSEGEMF